MRPKLPLSPARIALVWEVDFEQPPGQWRSLMSGDWMGWTFCAPLDWPRLEASLLAFEWSGFEARWSAPPSQTLALPEGPGASFTPWSLSLSPPPLPSGQTAARGWSEDLWRRVEALGAEFELLFDGLGAARTPLRDRAALPPERCGPSDELAWRARAERLELSRGLSPPSPSTRPARSL